MLSPQHIAALTSEDFDLWSPARLLYEYATRRNIVRFEEIYQYFGQFGQAISEQELPLLLDASETLLFKEGRDKQGKYWSASVLEGYVENNLDDDIDQLPFDDEDGGEDQMADYSGGEMGIEMDDFGGTELSGVNAPPEPSDLSNVDADFGSGLGGGQDIETPTVPGNQDDAPPAAQPMAMPELVAQIMRTMMPQMAPQDAPQAPVAPQAPMAPQAGGCPACQSGGCPTCGQPPAQPGPGEEGAVAQDSQPFGADGDQYTIDPLLNNMTQEAGISQNPQSANEPVTGAATSREQLYPEPGEAEEVDDIDPSTPSRYSPRMREAKSRRQTILVETWLSKVADLVQKPNADRDTLFETGKKLKRLLETHSGNADDQNKLLNLYRAVRNKLRTSVR